MGKSVNLRGCLRQACLIHLWYTYLYMKHISIIIPKGSILGSLEGSRQILSQVNQFFQLQGQAPAFKIQLVGLTQETLVSGGLFTVNSNAL